MQKRILGNTGYEITRVGLGAWAMGGGGWAFGWGPQDDKESIDTIHYAVDRGINWIDTAAVYGLGHSEEIIARALEEVPREKRPFVFTKCSLTWDQRGRISHNLQPDSLRKEMEGSLRRLRVETIDLYQIHWPAFSNPGNPSAPGLEDAWSTLAEMQSAGKVRHIGVSNFNVAQMERIRKIASISTLQPPYSLLKRGIEAEILPYCAGHGIGVIVYSPMQCGLLTGAMTRERVASLPNDDWRKNNPDFREPKLTQALQQVERLRAVGSRRGRTPAEIAIAWVLRHPSVAGAIVGARRRSQLEGTIGAGELVLSPEEIEEIG